MFHKEQGCRRFTSGATAALIRESFPNQKGVVVSETAPIPDDQLDISLEEVVFNVDWEITAKDPEKLELVEPVLDVEPEKEKPPAVSRSNCLRSSAPRRVKRKPTKKCRICTQEMIEEGTYWSDESEPESVEDGCLLLGLTGDLIDRD